MKINDKQKRAFQSLKDQWEGKPVQQQVDPLAPRPAITSEAPMNDPATYNRVMGSIDAKDRARQMQELQDAQDIAAFDEDPNSEANLKVAKLRALLGQ